jgi:hypothetical protein
MYCTASRIRNLFNFEHFQIRFLAVLTGFAFYASMRRTVRKAGGGSFTLQG